MSKYKAKCVIGMDAHAPNQLMDESAVYLAVNFCKRHNLNVVDVIDKIKQRS